ncbi:MAG TPA: hypothetical protein VF328_13955, partial [Mycobacterium sp.]
VLGSGAARSCQQPGLALALARGDYIEIGESGGRRGRARRRRGVVQAIRSVVNPVWSYRTGV